MTSVANSKHSTTTKSKKHAGKSSLRAKILLAIVSIVVADFLVAQVAKVCVFGWDPERVERTFRVRSDIYHHDLKKMVDVSAIWETSAYRIKTNSLGFKDAENRVVALDSSARRVLLIGDSFTEGIGVEFEKTYAGIIAKTAAARGVEVLNAGVVSYSPAIYYRKVKYLIEDVGLRFTDLVVFLDLSDIADEALAYDFDATGAVTHNLGSTIFTDVRFSRDEPLGLRIKRFWKSNSIIIRIADAAKDAIFKRELPAKIGTQLGGWTVDEAMFEEFGRRGLEKARVNLRRLLDLLRKNDVRMTLVVYPWPDQINAEDHSSRHVVYWRTWSTSMGIPFIDLFPVFLQRDKSDTLSRYFMRGDVHYNEAGHRLTAENFLKQFDLSPR